MPSIEALDNVLLCFKPEVPRSGIFGVNVIALELMAVEFFGDKHLPVLPKLVRNGSDFVVRRMANPLSTARAFLLKGAVPAGNFYFGAQFNLVHKYLGESFFGKNKGLPESSPCVVTTPRLRPT